MCGIIGYTGFSDARGVLIKGLKVLEYRGYDSAGIAVKADNGSKIIKCKGRVEQLDEITKDISSYSTGIGHTRWATHGEVCSKNSHPHKFGRVTLVHNGIIENYQSLITKFSLQKELISDTDSEAAAAVIDKYYDNDPLDAIKNAVKEFKGTFAFAIMFDDIPDRIFAVRNVSPIVICSNNDGSYIASDIIAIGKYSAEYFVLPEMCIAVLDKKNVKVYDFKGNSITPELRENKNSTADYGKGGYPFFMDKEIMEQPQVIEKTIQKRIKNNRIDLSSDNIDDSIFENIANILIIACGTAMHAGLIGKGLIEAKVRIPCEVHYASEFIYSTPIINKNSFVICISQSGETIDTLEALKYAKSKGAKSLSIINVEGSSIARESDYVIYTNAGPEIAVASTKAYTTQLCIFFLLTAKLAQINKTMNETEITEFISSIKSLPDAVKYVLDKKDKIHSLSKSILSAEHVFMIGRGQDYYSLMEASLKLKEISYIHCEAFASGELKHGTIALITDSTPVVALMTQDKLKLKQISNINEVKSRGAKVITLIKKSLNDKGIECSFELPDLCDEFMVVPSVVSMQLLAYYVSSDKGIDVDKPRNLAKVVTVE
ncbi:MAG: glutamine--fructose-6-phosphate transaminase (isomerizing) [Eubacterium sp.]